MQSSLARVHHVAFVFSYHGLHLQQLTGKSLILIERSVHSHSETPSSILLIRLSSLGDVILATPVVRVLRVRYPNARIDVAVAREYAEVWKGNPYVNTVVIVDKSRSAFHTLRRSTLSGIASRYDIVLDLQNNLRSLVLRYRYGRKRFVVNSMRREKQALVSHTRDARALPHVVERYFNAASSLDVRNDGVGLDLWLMNEASEHLHHDEVVQTHKNRVVAIAPGSKHFTKRWPPAAFAQCAERLLHAGYEVVLIGSSFDRQIFSEVLQRIDSTARQSVRSVIAESLDETLRIIDTASCVIANDSSIVHIAAARHVPVIDVYGSTVPAFGFTPYKSDHVIVETDVECRPCTHFGRSECPKGHFRCMNDIDVNSVVSSAMRFLAS